MVDKGFNIADVLKGKGIVLNIPCRKNNKQFDKKLLIEVRRIASLLREHLQELQHLCYSIPYLTK